MAIAKEKLMLIPEHLALVSKALPIKLIIIASILARLIPHRKSVMHMKKRDL